MAGPTGGGMGGGMRQDGGAQGSLGRLGLGGSLGNMGGAQDFLRQQALGEQGVAGGNMLGGPALLGGPLPAGNTLGGVVGGGSVKPQIQITPRQGGQGSGNESGNTLGGVVGGGSVKPPVPILPPQGQMPIMGRSMMGQQNRMQVHNPTGIGTQQASNMAAAKRPMPAEQPKKAVGMQPPDMQKF